MAFCRHYATKVVIILAATADGINVRRVDNDGTELCQNESQHCCNSIGPTKTVENFDEAPMVLFSGACSGSSAVLSMAQDIAELSNRPVLDCGGGFELLADISGGFYGSDHKELPATVLAFHNRAVSANRSLVFKAEDRFMEQPETMEVLEDLKSKFAVLKRWNKIDVALCTVRDCFTQGFTPAAFGYMVDENGKKISDCNFRGRGSNESTGAEQVLVDTSNLLENLRHLMVHVSDNNEEFLEKTGVAFQKLSYDDLFKYYSGTPDDLVSSSVAWNGFMQGLGVPTNFDIVYSYLKNARGTFEMPKKHSEMIANFDTVKRVLTNCEKEDCQEMVKMLRE